MKTPESFVVVLCGMAFVMIACAAINVAPVDGNRLLGFLIAGFLASTAKIRVLGLTGTYSLNFIVMLAASRELPFAENLLLATVCALSQSMVRALHRPLPIQIAFNVANLILSSAGAVLVSQLLVELPKDWQLLRLIASGAVFYAINTGLTSMVLSLAQEGSIDELWKYWQTSTIHFYLLGCTVAGTWSLLSPHVQGKSTLLFVGFLWWIQPLLRAHMVSHPPFFRPVEAAEHEVPPPSHP